MRTQAMEFSFSLVLHVLLHGTVYEMELHNCAIYEELLELR
jgi:hypothetical protein